MGDMTRLEAIEVLKDIVSKPMLYSNHIIGACRVALASLETDEAYQLEYERTTKNNLAVEKTDMIDKSNFSQEQYKTDLQSAYDCGYAQAKNDLGVDCIDRVELLKAMDTWDKFGYTTRYGLERLDKDDKGFVPYVKYDDMVNCVKGMPSVTPIRPKGHWIKMPLIEASQTYTHKCSLCGRRILANNVGLSEFPYCHCGAKMEVEE